MEGLVKGKALLVGEGDFSFAVSMVEKLPSKKCTCIIATSLETAESIKKHQYAARNITSLKEKGVTVRLDTDATQLHTSPLTKDDKFFCIIFNFPHVGGKSNHKKNRKLLNDFFASAVQVLECNGQIMMTLCKGQGGTPADQPMRAWHDSWQVVSMAANSSLILTKIVPFKADEYRVYTSTGFRSLDKGFNTENALTHVFEMAEPVKVPDSTCNLRVKLGTSIFQCRPYIYRKLLHIRCINGNKDHPIHRLYEMFLKQLTVNTTNKIENQGLQFPYKRSITNASSCENRLAYTGCYGYKLIKSDISDSADIDDNLSDVINEAGAVEATEVADDINLDWNPLPFSDPMELGIIKLNYGPIFKPCEISVNKSPVSYSTTVSWPVSIEQDDLEHHKGDFSKAVNEVTSKITNIIDNMIVNSRWKIEIRRNVEEKDQDFTDDTGRNFLVANISICDKALNSSEGASENNVKIEKSIVIGDCKMKKVEDNLSLKPTHVTVYINIDLCLLACCVYSIENEKLLWSEDTRIISQFSQLDLIEPNCFVSPENDSIKSKHNCIVTDENAQNVVEVMDNLSEDVAIGYQKKDFNVRSPSLFPMTFVHDMSFWENESVPFCTQEYFDIIRDLADDSVINVELIDTYTEPVSGKTSRCYRLTFQSVDKALSYDTSWKLQSLIRLEVERIMKIGLR